MFAFVAFPCNAQFLPSVTELVVAQCYYLDFDDKNRQKPIYVYLNSTGCINEKGQAVSADNEFYAIWAALGFTRAPLYTGGVPARFWLGFG
jgi:ATP-dependent Clp protease protease subunit